MVLASALYATISDGGRSLRSVVRLVDCSILVVALVDRSTKRSHVRGVTIVAVVQQRRLTTSLVLQDCPNVKRGSGRTRRGP